MRNIVQVILFSGLLLSAAGTPLTVDPAAAGSGEALSYDFSTTTGTTGTGAAAPAGWSYESIGKSDGAAYFNAALDTMRSPTYAGSVTNVTLVCKCSNGASTRALKIIPLIVSSTPEAVTTTNLTAAVTFAVSTTKATQTAAFPLSLGANAFLVRLEGSGTGNWTVYSGSVVQTGTGLQTALGTPANITFSDLTATSCRLSWDAVAGATGYLVAVQTNAVSPAAEGTVVWHESFDRVPQGTSAIPEGSLASLADWEAWTYAYLFYADAGSVRIGNTSYRGTLATGPLGVTGENLTLIVTAWRAEEGRNMPVEVMSGATTNLATDIALAVTRTTSVRSLPALSATDGLVFHSTTNAQRGRVYLDDVRIVAGFRPATTSAVEIARHAVSTPADNLANLPDGSVWVRIAAVNGGVTNWSEAVALERTPSAPSDVWRVSEFASGTRHADFMSLTNITQTTPWANGVTLPGFFAFLGDAAATSIAFDTGKAYKAGIYASWTNAMDVPPALALLGSGGSSVAVELHVLNDTPRTLEGIDLSFAVRQTTFTGFARQLACQIAVVGAPAERPAETDWMDVPALAFTAATEGTDPVTQTKTATVGGLAVASGSRIFIRWSVAKATNSPMLGVCDVCVGVRYKPVPMVIIIR